MSLLSSQFNYFGLMNRFWRKPVAFTAIVFFSGVLSTSLSSCTSSSSPAGTSISANDPFIARVSPLIADKKLDEANKIVAEALSKNADDSKAIYLSALIDVANKNNEAALAKLNRALDLTRSFAQAYSARSLVEYRLGNNDSALEDANHAIELDENFALAYHRRALIELRRKNYEGAISDLNMTEKLDPQHSPYYLFTNRADAYLGLNKYPEALEQYTKALALAPAGNLDALLGKALSEARLKKWQDCKADSQKVLSASRENPMGMSLLAVATSQSGQHAAAVALFQKALKQATNAVLFESVYDGGDGALSDLTTACMDSAVPARAISIIKDIDSRRPLELSEQVVFARAYVADNQLDRAAGILSDCLATQPDYTDARIALVRIYGRKGLISKAREVQNDGLRLCKSPQARNLLRILH
jgi:tetratricopeptide (TPR) repeat protein